MLTYKDKDLDVLTLQECYEFEKEMLNRLTVASKSQMSDLITIDTNNDIDINSKHPLTQTTVQTNSITNFCNL